MLWVGLYYFLFWGGLYYFLVNSREDVLLYTKENKRNHQNLGSSSHSTPYNYVNLGERFYYLSLLHLWLWKYLLGVVWWGKIMICTSKEVIIYIQWKIFQIFMQIWFSSCLVQFTYVDIFIHSANTILITRMISLSLYLSFPHLDLP